METLITVCKLNRKDSFAVLLSLDQFKKHSFDEFLYDTAKKIVQAFLKDNPALSLAANKLFQEYVEAFIRIHDTSENRFKSF